MDHLPLVIDVVVLIFALAFLAAIVYIPYKMFQFVIRGIAKTTVKTYQTIIPSKK